ncbi:hypothetical protein GCM10020367_22070 [Streptomyces sannanensis]|uniref:Uncharacterized protein n=1 Tax=Streptomyces sannanensis TaxID=285536 RepID=A0ABP6SAI9_9ACTN
MSVLELHQLPLGVPQGGLHPDGFRRRECVEGPGAVLGKDGTGAFDVKLLDSHPRGERRPRANPGVPVRSG